MSNLAVQASFNSGEWAPTLYSRVDMQKYRSGAALLQNWFVDYRGGASTRPGSQYILQAFKSSTAVRLIPFQASFAVGYILEFGDQYIRFFFNKAPVLEIAQNITGITNANPGVLTIPAHNYADGDWVFISGIVGMTELNGNYYIVANATTNTFTLTTLSGVAVDTTSFSAYISGGTAARVYTIASPYSSSELAAIKFAQNVDQMILCHPNHQPYIITLLSAANWTLLPILFGTTALTPTNVVATTTLTTGTTVHYSYVVTSVDAAGQESGPSAPANISSAQDLRSVAGTNLISWSGVSGAASYNVYKAIISFSGALPAGSSYGFIGNTNATLFPDSNISSDFSQTPPIPKNPFQGAGLQSVTVTNKGVYTSPPTAVVDAAPSGGQTATVQPVLQVVSTTMNNAGVGFVAGQSYTEAFGTGVVVKVLTVGGFGNVSTYQIVGFGAIYSGTAPVNLVFVSATGGGGANELQLSPVWGVGVVNIISPGAGYTAVPNITFSSGAATATAVLAPISQGNPTVPGFFQQRLILAAPPSSPQTFFMSQTGFYFNFNVSNPVLPDDAITGSLVSGQLNSIKSLVPQTSGMLVFTDKFSFLINGGSQGAPVTPAAISANAQSFNGVSDIPPIIVNFDVLYVQAKGSVIRDSSYNIYANVFTGTDISILASHLFYGFTVTEWGFAEEPFKLVQAIRDDGVLLTLTFLKEQEFTAWTHSITDGNFKSVAVVTEVTTDSGNVDGTYVVVERIINGTTTKYIERFADRQFPNGAEDAWCVDCGIQYTGAPRTNFDGAQHLAGKTVTGLADGQVITPFVMPDNGSFTLPIAASKVVVGIGFICDLQTLALELGEPTVQGKVKKISNVDIRVADALGLKIGPDFNHLVEMKDLVRGNVSSMLTGQQSQIITDLVTGDARTVLSPAYTVPGQYCIRQDLPLPATVTGVIPQITIGDGP